jgi:hypothetical protein
MSTITDITTLVQEQVLTGLELSQRWVLGTLRTTAETLDSVLPDLGKVPEQPLAQHLPNPRETVDAGFDFVERLVASQRAFASKVAALAPKPARPASRKAQAA